MWFVTVVIIYCLVDSITCVYFFNKIYRTEENKISMHSIILCFAIFIPLVLYCFNYISFNFEIYLFIITMVYLLTSTYGRISEKIFWSVFYFSVYSITALMGFIIASRIFNESIFELSLEPSIKRTLILSLVKIIQIGVYVATAKNSGYVKHIGNSILLASAALLCIIRSLGVRIVFFLTNSYHGIDNQLVVIVYTLLISQFLLTYILIRFSREVQTNLEFEMNMKSEMLKSNHYKDLVKIHSELRAWKHDFRNHLSVMLALLKSHDEKLLTQYIKEIDLSLENAEKKIYTESVAIDSILVSKKNIADSKNIAMNISVSILDRININNIDLCILLGNVLDNSIESCAKLSQNKQINVNIASDVNNFVLKVSNSSSNQFNMNKNTFVTTKKGGYHGIGLSQIDKVVKKYNGYVSRKYENGRFETNILINNISYTA